MSWNPQMTLFQNLDAMGLTYIRQAGSVLNREIYDGDECVFVGTPWEITAWICNGSPSRMRITKLKKRRPR